MENNFKYIVYCTTNIVTKKIYIGVHRISSDVFDGYIGNGVYINRASTYEHPKTKFQYAVKKYGPNKFIRTTIATFDNELDAYELEELIVNEQFLARQDVYNLALGGTNGAYYLTCHKVYQYDSNGNYVQEFSSINVASKLIGRAMVSIWRAIHNKIKCKNYYWSEEKYDKLDLTNYHIYEGPHKIPIYQYSLSGEYECCYNSINDAARILNISSANLSKSVKLGTICNQKRYSSVFNETFQGSRNEQTRNTAVHQYSLEGEYINSYKNMAEAKKALNIKSNIYDAIKLGRTCGGFQWSFEKLERMDKIKPKSGKSRKVGKYDKDWNLIEEYVSLSEAKRVNGASIEHVIRGRNEFSKGFRYKYIDD